MEYHELANIFPMMSDDEFGALVKDIKANGQIEPIWMYEGKILDGRNRYKACKQLGIKPKFKQWKGKGSAVRFVASLNVHRRHLTSGQKAIIAAQCLEMYEKEARERQGERTDIKEKSPESSKGQARDLAAADFGTNGRYVSEAKKLLNENPDLADKVVTQEISMNAAKTEATKRKKKADKKKVKQRTTPAPAELVSAKNIPVLICAKAENMPQIDDESIDLIITSPPYNLDKQNWPMGGGGNTPRESGIGYDSIDDSMPIDEYMQWQTAVFRELWRVAKDGASLFYNHKTRTKNGRLIHPIQWIMTPDNPWTLRQEIVWDRKSTHNHSATLFWPIDERIYWMTKGRPALPDTPIGLPSVWREHGPTRGNWHPAPFTEALPTMIIKAVAKKGSVILDPFAGSCTVGKVARKLGFDSFCVDLSQNYLDKAMEENKWTNQQSK